MRNYVPLDDGQEPTDFDEYYDVPAKTEKDIAYRAYIKVERNPEAAAIIAQRQAEALLEVLHWIRQYRKQRAAEGRPLD
jgi:hypothetical protein